MKFELTADFRKDLRAVGRRGHADQLLRVLLEKFLPAAQAFVDDPSRGWPAGLRVKGVVGSSGVFEFTWSMNDPDGRATFQWTTIDGSPALRLRRAGDHSIFKRP